MNTPTLAVVIRNGYRTPIYVPKGDIVTVSDAPLDGTRLIEVHWNGETVMMFSIDLRERGEPV
jgi:hypothetical protein